MTEYTETETEIDAQKSGCDTYAWDIYLGTGGAPGNLTGKSTNYILSQTPENDPTLFFTKYCIKWFTTKCTKKCRIPPKDITVRYVQITDQSVPTGPDACCKDCPNNSDYQSQNGGSILDTASPDIIVVLYVCFNIPSTKIIISIPSVFNKYCRTTCIDKNTKSKQCIYSLGKQTRCIIPSEQGLPILSKHPAISNISFDVINDDELDNHCGKDISKIIYYTRLFSLNFSQNTQIQTSIDNVVEPDSGGASLGLLCPDIKKILCENPKININIKEKINWFFGSFNSVLMWKNNEGDCCPKDKLLKYK